LNTRQHQAQRAASVDLCRVHHVARVDVGQGVESTRVGQLAIHLALDADELLTLQSDLPRLELHTNGARPAEFSILSRHDDVQELLLLVGLLLQHVLDRIRRLISPLYMRSHRRHLPLVKDCVDDPSIVRLNPDRTDVRVLVGDASFLHRHRVETLITVGAEALVTDMHRARESRAWISPPVEKSVCRLLEPELGLLVVV